MAATITCARCHEETASRADCGSCGHDPLLEGRWAFRRMLGHGAAGHTWLATDEETGEDVAIKELSFRRITELKQLELFEREAETLSSLDHAGIPTYAEHFAVEDDRHVSFYLVQELIDGEPLSVGDGTDEEEVVELLEQMAEILAYLQDRRPPVVHRDIKPSNIMRRSDGRYVLIDFGSTRLVAGATMGGSTIAGTLGYMAPEQLQGDASAASDVYGLGATAIALLAGRDASDVLDIRYPGRWRDEVTVSPALGDLLDRMVDVDETTRLRDGGALLEALGDLGQEDSGSAERDPPKSRPKLPRDAHGEARALLSTAKPERETWRDIVVKIGRNPIGMSLGWMFIMLVFSGIALSFLLFGLQFLPEPIPAAVPVWSNWYPVVLVVLTILAYFAVAIVGRHLDGEDGLERSVIDAMRWRQVRRVWRNFRGRSGWRPILGGEFDVVWPRGSELRETFREVVDRLWDDSAETSSAAVKKAYDALLSLRDAGLTKRQREHLDLVLLALRARTGRGEELGRSIARVEEMEPRGVTLDALLAASDEAEDEEIAANLAARYVATKEALSK